MTCWQHRSRAKHRPDRSSRLPYCKKPKTETTRAKENLPTVPCAVQIPLQLSAAFKAAAQHDWKSPATMTTLYAVDMLLLKASDAGITSNTASIQQQLQQSGILQQLSSFLAAMTAELQAETAALAAGDAASGNVQQYTAPGSLRDTFTVAVSCRHILWGFWEPQGLTPAAATWMWSHSGHTVAIMQLATTALQHISSCAQHVLPAVRQRSPQLAGKFLRTLQRMSQLAGVLCTDIAGIKAWTKPPRQHISADTWKQLVMSPHMLPCVGTLAVLAAAHLGTSVAMHGVHEKGSSGNSSNNGSSGSSSSSSSSCATGQPEPRQQGPPGGSSTGTSSSKRDASGILTASQLQLLQLLGLAPEVIDWVMQTYKSPAVYGVLQSALDACADCCATSWDELRNRYAGAGAPEGQLRQFDEQLYSRMVRLLPTVLLPCASSLLLPGAPQLTQAVSGFGAAAAGTKQAGLVCVRPAAHAATHPGPPRCDTSSHTVCYLVRGITRMRCFSSQTGCCTSSPTPMQSQG